MRGHGLCSATVMISKLTSLYNDLCSEYLHAVACSCYLRQQGGRYDDDDDDVIVLSVRPSVCHSVNRITDERGNGRRPNLAGMGKG